MAPPRTVPFLLAFLVALHATVAQEDSEAQKFAACHGREDAGSRDKEPAFLCSYTADVKIGGDCRMTIQESIMVPHWPGGPFTLRVAKQDGVEGNLLQDHIQAAVGNSSTSRNLIFEIDGDPISRENVFEANYELDEFKDTAVRFSYQYEMKDAVLNNTKTCSHEINYEGPPKVAFWRGAEWSPAAAKGDVVVKMFYDNITKAEGGGADVTPDLVTVRGEKVALFEFGAVDPNGIKVLEAAVFVDAVCGGLERICLPAKQKAATRGLVFGKYTVGQFIGILIGAVVALVIIFYVLKCMCMAAPGGKRSGNYGYTGY